ncbi:hypothetical protein L1887_49111 [Cichorium endivia]|nr:hypothetical protein L1887_49111 [Cichorium endivia]
MQDPAASGGPAEEPRRLWTQGGQRHGVLGPVGTVHEGDSVHVGPGSSVVEHEKIPQEVCLEDEARHGVPGALDRGVVVVRLDPVLGACIVEEFGLEAHLGPLFVPRFRRRLAIRGPDGGWHDRSRAGFCGVDTRRGLVDRVDVGLGWKDDVVGWTESDVAEDVEDWQHDGCDGDELASARGALCATICAAEQRRVVRRRVVARRRGYRADVKVRAVYSHSLRGDELVLAILNGPILKSESGALRPSRDFWSPERRKGSMVATDMARRRWREYGARGACGWRRKDEALAPVCDGAISAIRWWRAA